MGLTSLQVCMDSSDWLQGTIHDETGLDSSSPSGGTDPMLACSRPLMERRLRPQHDQALKCPRCDSTHTKFCYYNNYSLSQPRYFCKTCRRYWTKGGTLRNIPVGGGCRKNKKVSSSSKKTAAANNNSNDNNNIHNHHQPHVISPNPVGSNIIMNSTDLQLSYPEQFSASNLFGIGTSTNNPNFMFENLTSSAGRAIDFMEGSGGGGGGGKYEAASHLYSMMGGGGYGADMGTVHGLGPSYHGTNLCSPFGGMNLDGINNTGINSFIDRGMIGYDHEANNLNEDHENMMNGIDVKPKLLALEWQDQSGCSSDHHGTGAGKSDSFGYVTGLGSSWSGLMNGYGPSTTNPLV